MYEFSGKLFYLFYLIILLVFIFIPVMLIIITANIFGCLNKLIVTIKQRASKYYKGPRDAHEQTP